MAGIIIDILRVANKFQDAVHVQDCTNDGVTSLDRAAGKTFIVFDDRIRGNYDLDDIRDDSRYVCLKVVRRRLNRREYVHLEPMFDGKSGHRMFGGNFGMTSDSRFREHFPYPLPIHDRVES